MKTVGIHDLQYMKLKPYIKPHIQDSHDAIVRITSSGICSNYLHFIRRTEGTLKKATFLDYEALGVVELIGRGIKNLCVGDRVIVPSIIDGSICPCCQQYHPRKDNLNTREVIENAVRRFPKNLSHLTKEMEYLRVPFADTSLIKLPEEEVS